VIAFDMATGRMKWIKQVTPNDVFIGGCRSGSGNPNCAEVVGPDFLPARGASIMGPGPAVAGGMVYVNSGDGSHGGRAGNVLLAFGLQ
jgi:outer membrane protein assembly factor BamB